MHVDDRRWRGTAMGGRARPARPTTQATDGTTSCRHFANYASLPATAMCLRLGAAHSLGCLLRDDSQVLSIALVDPLAGHYGKDYGCTYRGRRISKWPVRCSMQAELLRLKDAVDTVIMVAVLQSVQDVPAVLQAAYNAAARGGASSLAITRQPGWRRHDGHNTAPFWDVTPCAINNSARPLSRARKVHLRGSRRSLPGALGCHHPRGRAALFRRPQAGDIVFI